jgi:hypothetical protein
MTTSKPHKAEPTRDLAFVSALVNELLSFSNQNSWAGDVPAQAYIGSRT